MISLLSDGDAAESVIRADMNAGWVDLIAHCITNLHAGRTVYLSDCMVYRDTDGRYIRVTD